MNSRFLLYAFLFSVSSGLVFAGEGQPGAHRSESPDGAAVSFANLADGDVLPPQFLVEFSITGMGIAPAGVKIDNTGHHHLLIDVVELPDFNQPLPASDNIRHFGKGQSETELKLPEGQHSLQLLLADHAHIPHNPPIMSEVIVIVVSVDAPPPD
jgi:hypothetical protein